MYVIQACEGKITISSVGFDVDPCSVFGRVGCLTLDKTGVLGIGKVHVRVTQEQGRPIVKAGQVTKSCGRNQFGATY